MAPARIVAGIAERYDEDHPIKVHFDNVVVAKKYIGPLQAAE